MIEVLRKPPTFEAVFFDGSNKEEFETVFKDCFVGVEFEEDGKVYVTTLGRSIYVPCWIVKTEGFGNCEVFTESEFWECYQKTSD